MKRRLSIVMLAAVAALAQDKSGHQATQVSAKTVPSAEPVITIHGLCDPQGSHAAKAGSCATAITRKQFESLVEALKATSRDIPPDMRRGLAESYSELLVYSDAARKAGLEQDPRFEQVKQFALMRALADMYRVHRAERARNVSPEEIQAYYQKNIVTFEEFQLSRITLPRNNPANLNDLEFRAKAQHLAGDLHERAAKGEDLDKLQKKAYETLGVKNPPATRMVAVRRGAFDPETEAEILALKPGSVTKVVERPGVYIFYRMENKRTASLDEARAEISRRLILEKMDMLTKALTNSVKVDYNDRYFGSTASSGWVTAGELQGGDSGGSSAVPQKPAPLK
ncbi:MAG: peptidyl-prolyl cis-trans isomerase [Acidobacteriia bacterium]|nr:peptidyl-prolyl cis-trans isomerase [Terriglobia bacterium]